MLGPGLWPQRLLGEVGLKTMRQLLDMRLSLLQWSPAPNPYGKEGHKNNN